MRSNMCWNPNEVTIGERPLHADQETFTPVTMLLRQKFIDTYLLCGENSGPADLHAAM